MVGSLAQSGPTKFNMLEIGELDGNGKRSEPVRSVALVH